jgi:hypothetical protein
MYTHICFWADVTVTLTVKIHSTPCWGVCSPYRGNKKERLPGMTTHWPAAMFYWGDLMGQIPVNNTLFPTEDYCSYKWGWGEVSIFMQLWRTFLAPKWPWLSLVPFKGPKMSRASRKVKILCRNHLESLNWPHLVIWQGRFHNTTPHLQQRCINS